MGGCVQGRGPVAVGARWNPTPLPPPQMRSWLIVGKRQLIPLTLRADGCLLVLIWRVLTDPPAFFPPSAYYTSHEANAHQNAYANEEVLPGQRHSFLIPLFTLSISAAITPDHRSYVLWQKYPGCGVRVGK